MRRRKRVVVGSILAAVAAVIGVACTFPDLQFKADDAVGEAGAEGGKPEGAAADAPFEVGADVLVLVDGGDPDAQIVKDAGKKVDASGCVSCDCDGDGFNDTMKAGCQDAGGEYDCDDTDTTTRPDQGFNTTPPYPPRNGDWNCKNGVERFYKSGIDCPNTAVASCDGTFGFSDNPSCAGQGTFVTCKVSGTIPILQTCIVGSQALATQACK